MVPIAAAEPVPEECPVPAELYKAHFSPTACNALCACWGRCVCVCVGGQFSPDCKDHRTLPTTCCGTGLGLGLTWTLQLLPAAQDANADNSTFLSQ